MGWAFLWGRAGNEVRSDNPLSNSVRVQMIGSIHFRQVAVFVVFLQSLVLVAACFDTHMILHHIANDCVETIKITLEKTGTVCV